MRDPNDTHCPICGADYTTRRAMDCPEIHDAENVKTVDEKNTNSRARIEKISLWCGWLGCVCAAVVVVVACVIVINGDWSPDGMLKFIILLLVAFILLCIGILGGMVNDIIDDNDS